MMEAIAACLAPMREAPLKILEPVERALGVALSPELAAYTRAFEQHELDACELELELRAPDPTATIATVLDSGDIAVLAMLVGLLTETSVIAVHDELAYLATWKGSARGTSRVYHFHPDDWGLWPFQPTIASHLMRLLSAEARAQLSAADLGPAEVEARLDPVRRFPRLGWLFHLFLGLGDLEQALVGAATQGDWVNDHELVPDHPGIATYWLWSHWAMGEDTQLHLLLDSTRETKSAMVAESRDLVRRLEAGQSVRLGLRTASQLHSLRERIVSLRHRR